MTLVDTDILIDAARQIPEAVECLADIEQQSALAISAIMRMELLVGCRDKTELRHTMATVIYSYSLLFLPLNRDIVKRSPPTDQ